MRATKKRSSDNGKSTIMDVAVRANVSVGTVSHVLSGKIPVSGVLRQRVSKAIEELGYEPNFHARGLRGRHASVIGLCLPHASTVYPNALSETLDRSATESGCSILHVFSRDDPAAEYQRVKELLGYGVGGLILFPSARPKKTLDLVHASAVPMVIMDRLTDAKRFDHVVLDDRRTMEAAVNIFLERGHRRVLFICRARRILATQHRLDGLSAARVKFPEPVRVNCIEIGDDEKSLERRLGTTLRPANRPTAIITSNSHQAVIVLRCLRNQGIKCPEQISLLTFDDPEWSGVVTPSLSAVRQPAESIAATTWAFLMSRMKAQAIAPRSVALEAEIQVRDSIAAAATATLRGNLKRRSPGARPKRAHG